MKGFLKKDLYLTIGYCRSIFLIVIVFMVVACAQRDNFFFLFYPAILVSLIAVSLFSYDERENFCSYAATMPQSRAAYVSAKYVISLLYGLICAVLTCFLQVVLCGNYAGSDALFIFAVMVLLVLFTPAITMPFMFRFGVEKGRFAYYIMIGVSSALAILIGSHGVFDGFGGSLPFVLLIFAAFVLFAVSWYLSVTFYKKREF